MILTATIYTTINILATALTARMSAMHVNDSNYNYTDGHNVWDAKPRLSMIAITTTLIATMSETRDHACAGDDWVSNAAHEFLLLFLVRFPQFRQRPLWLSGESYAGHYVPQLALKIVADPGVDKALNLQGYLIGTSTCSCDLVSCCRRHQKTYMAELYVICFTHVPDFGTMWLPALLDPQCTGPLTKIE